MCYYIYNKVSGKSWYAELNQTLTLFVRCPQVKFIKYICYMTASFNPFQNPHLLPPHPLEDHLQAHPNDPQALQNLVCTVPAPIHPTSVKKSLTHTNGTASSSKSSCAPSA